MDQPPRLVNDPTPDIVEFHQALEKIIPPGVIFIGVTLHLGTEYTHHMTNTDPLATAEILSRVTSNIVYDHRMKEPK